MSEARDADPGEAPRVGARFGRYRIESQVGRGGMGVVFRATDTDLDRQVALKFLAPELFVDKATRERFIREARAAAAIEHPHIVPIYEAGAISGTLFIAMRLIPGPDLAQVLRRESPLDPSRTVAIASQLAGALDAAHLRGLIHRDVKPANVLLEDRGAEWAWLTDFGLTRRLGDGAGWSTAGLAGTVDYMAPEAITQGAIDGRSDQYSLACLVVHCMTGSPPFEGPTEASVMYAHLNTEPPRPDGRFTGADAAMDAALRRALAKDSGERFLDCSAFVAALQARPVTAVTVPAPVPSVGEHTVAARGPVGRSIPWRHLIPAMAMAGVVLAGAWLTSMAGRDGGHTSALPSPSLPSRSLPVRSLAPGGASGLPALASDAGVIVFAGDRGGDSDIWAMLPDGTGLRRLTRAATPERMPTFPLMARRSSSRPGPVAIETSIARTPMGPDGSV